MKRNWEYKKLGDVCTVVGGSTPKTNIPEYWGGENYWVTPAELTGEKYIESTERTITDEAVAKTNLTLLPVGTVLLSSRAPIGKVCITRSPMYCNQGFKNIVCSKCLLNEYVYWWLKGKTDYLNSLGVGATFKEISKRTVEQIVIPVPPLEEQSRIVAELDLLTGIIDKQNAQLKELDNLAQSIFYDMFGDPIENPKRWEVKKLGEVCDLKAGKNIKASELHSRCEKGLYPCYGGNGIRGYIAKYSHEGVFPIIGRQGALCGNVNLASGVFYATEHAVVCTPSIAFDSVFLFYTLTGMHLNQYAQGVAQPGLAVQNLTPLPIIVPPLALQQSFAKKIQSIEKQKETIRASIADTQKLLDYTMDKYFG